MCSFGTLKNRLDLMVDLLFWGNFLNLLIHGCLALEINF